MDVVEKIESHGSSSGKTNVSIRINDCGVLADPEDHDLLDDSDSVTQKGVGNSGNAVDQIAPKSTAEDLRDRLDDLRRIEKNIQKKRRELNEETVAKLLKDIDAEKARVKRELKKL